jgi:glycosyltransferase involved in cell wall biosynthesis
VLPRGISVLEIRLNEVQADEYVKALHRVAGQNPNGIFTGYVTGWLKAELFSNARLFVIPSALKSLPIALLEAMSYGIPCLASDIPAHREVVTHGLTGFLFPASNSQALTEAVRNLLSGEEATLRSVGERARQTVAREYDWERVADLTEELYRTLLRDKKQ